MKLHGCLVRVQTTVPIAPLGRRKYGHGWLHLVLFIARLRGLNFLSALLGMAPQERLLGVGGAGKTLFAGEGQPWTVTVQSTSCDL